MFVSKTALLIVHQETSDPARVGRLVAERGYRLDVRCPNIGDALPESMDRHDAVVVFGGPMSANDGSKMPGIRAELDFIPTALESGKPFFGVCLGAQLLARALGAPVSAHPDGLAEIGYTAITPTAAGRGHFDGPMMVYQWHREGFELPHGATLLAEGETFANQAYRYGNAVGIQFHPEVVLETIERWTTVAAEHLKRPGAQPREAHIAGFARWDPALDRWLNRFLDHLLGPAPGGGTAAEDGRA